MNFPPGVCKLLSQLIGKCKDHFASNDVTVNGLIGQYEVSIEDHWESELGKKL